MRARVVERGAARVEERLRQLQRGVHLVGRDVAAVDVDDLLEAARRVETEREVRGLHRIRQLLRQQEAAVAEGEVDLVAVAERQGRGQGGVHRRVGKPAEPLQRVGDELALEAELRGVIDVLPLAAAADAEVRAARRDARRGRPQHRGEAGLEVVRLELRDLRADAVADGDHALDEHGEPVVEAAEALGRLGEVADVQLDGLAAAEARGGVRGGRRRVVHPRRSMIAWAKASVPSLPPRSTVFAPSRSARS